MTALRQGTFLAARLAACGLEDLANREAFDRADLERVLAAGNPLVAAALADSLRAATSGAQVTMPLTLRIRTPCIDHVAEAPSLVSHVSQELGAVRATEIELVGALPADADLASLCEIVGAVREDHADLPIRAFTADELLAVARTDGVDPDAVVSALRGAGWTTLSWRAGAEHDVASLDVHHALHRTGGRSMAVLAYAGGGIGADYLDRIDAVRADASGFLSVLPLPHVTESASPLEAAAGTQDTLAFSLARLGLGDVIPHVTVDAHILGHKLGAVLLSAGADDFVGAQCAPDWPEPTSDGPRPLNELRVRAFVEEARRIPVVRDGSFAAQTE